MTTCPQCKSEAVVAGTIPGADGDTTNGFQPSASKIISKLLLRKVRLIRGEEFQGCTDCGLIWAYTNPKELSAFVSKHVKGNP